MSSTRPDDKASDIPEMLFDNSSKTHYRRLRFFGKVIQAFLAGPGGQIPQNSKKKWLELGLWLGAKVNGRLLAGWENIMAPGSSICAISLVLGQSGAWIRARTMTE
jgi:hypothetical protein